MKKTLFITVLLVCAFGFFSQTSLTFAQTTTTGLAQLSGCSGLDCSACNVVDLANGVIKWLIGILFVVCACLLAYAGVKLVTSGGNSHALDEAKGMFTNILIGFLIILSAWLIIDTIMRALVGTKDNPGQLVATGTASGWLFWSDVQCQELYVPEKNDPETLNYEPVFTAADNEISSPTTITTVSPGGIYYPTAGGVPDGQLSYQPGISAQRAHASAELNTLLNCMASKLPSNVGVVSSISDSRIVNGTKTFAQCWGGGCAHTAGSCHYGNGFGVVGRSYAADFGDENNADDIKGAAYACGAKAAAVHNGNHVHVTSRGCRGY